MVSSESLVGKDHLQRLFWPLVEERVSLRRLSERDAVRDELPQLQPTQQPENSVHTSNSVPARRKLRVHTTDLRGSESHPSPMEMSPERKRDGLGAVPRGYDDRPLSRHSVYRALQSSPGPAGFDRNVSPPPARDFHDTIIQPSRGKRAVSARGERQPAALL